MIARHVLHLCVSVSGSFGPIHNAPRASESPRTRGPGRSCTSVRSAGAGRTHASLERGGGFPSVSEDRRGGGDCDMASLSAGCWRGRRRRGQVKLTASASIITRWTRAARGAGAWHGPRGPRGLFPTCAGRAAVVSGSRPAHLRGCFASFAAVRRLRAVVRRRQNAPYLIARRDVAPSPPRARRESHCSGQLHSWMYWYRRKMGHTIVGGGRGVGIVRHRAKRRSETTARNSHAENWPSRATGRLARSHTPTPIPGETTCSQTQSSGRTGAGSRAVPPAPRSPSAAAAQAWAGCCPLSRRC